MPKNIIKAGGTGRLITKNEFSFPNISLPSVGRYINLDTACGQYDPELEAYLSVPANPYPVQINVTLPRKPKSIKIKINNFNSDNANVYGIALKSPDDKVSLVYDVVPYYYNSRIPRRITNINAIISDEYLEAIFPDSEIEAGSYHQSNVTLYGKPYINQNLRGIGISNVYNENYYKLTGRTTENDLLLMSNFSESIVNYSVGARGEEGPVYQNNVCGFYTSSEQQYPWAVIGHVPDLSLATSAGNSILLSNQRFYYSKLNRLISNNYNGIWKLYIWDTNGDGDVEGDIGSIDLIFKT
jgi:hypothetical protein